LSEQNDIDRVRQFAQGGGHQRVMSGGIAGHQRLKRAFAKA
jgi:hypothetical protein